MQSRPTTRSLAAAIANLKAAETPASTPAPDGRVSKQEAATAASKTPPAAPTPERADAAMNSTPQKARELGSHVWLEIDGRVFDPAPNPLRMSDQTWSFLRDLCVGTGRFESYVYPGSENVFVDSVRTSYHRDQDQDGTPGESLVRSVAKTIILDKT